MRGEGEGEGSGLGEGEAPSLTARRLAPLALLPGVAGTLLRLCLLVRGRVRARARVRVRARPTPGLGQARVRAGWLLQRPLAARYS